jgi:predicted RNase H-like HicB family nuclease
MTKAKFVYWQTEQFWIGHFVDFPDYLTQGESLEDLKESLRELYKDLTSGEIPGIRKLDELVVA